jgi:phosphatidate cytidylyltransferase
MNGTPSPQPSPSRERGNSNWSDLATRAASGIVMAVVAFVLVWIGGWPFNIMCILLGLLIFWEWYRITQKNGTDIPWLIAGLIYAIAPVAALIYLRNGDHGFTAIPSNDPRLAIVLAMIVVVVATDVGAYFSGRTIGGPKLAPRISPKKTWAGFFGGIIAAMIFLAAAEYYLPFISTKFMLADPSDGAVSVFLLNAGLFALPVSVVSQIGDLFESWLKRKFDVKDSSQLIPGHGGVMDRLDGLIFAASFVALYVCFVSA